MTEKLSWTYGLKTQLVTYIYNDIQVSYKERPLPLLICNLAVVEWPKQKLALHILIDEKICDNLVDR